jgi:hypothetical protein
MAGQVLGTPYYMSPEQWGEVSRDGNFEIDGRADIYSLGLVAYQMICGKRAYSGGTLPELRREHISVTPPPLCEKVPEVPPGFSAAIDRAISKDRDDRQRTAGQLAGELRAALGDAVGSVSTPRPAPETPHDESPLLTQGVSGTLDTNSDVNAPTIITLDAVPTSPPRVPGPPPSKPPGEREPAGELGQLPSFADIEDMASSATRLQAPKGLDVAGKKSRGKSLALVGAVVLLLVLAVVGVGGFFAVNWFKAKPDASAKVAKSSSGADPTAGSAATKEFGRYWLEVLPAALAEPQRVAGAVPLASGQAFKFHFEIEDDGYLYIIGPGEKSQPTAFLTDKPASVSGVDTNQVTKGSDFSFPSGTTHWLELDKKPGTEDYTIIFSRQPLSTPAFFNSEATGNPLTETEQSELNDFLAKNKSSEPVTELNDKDGAAPFVALKVAQSKGSNGEPVIFHVRIQHK